MSRGVRFQRGVEAAWEAISKEPSLALAPESINEPLALAPESTDEPLGALLCGGANEPLGVGVPYS